MLGQVLSVYWKLPRLHRSGRFDTRFRNCYSNLPTMVLPNFLVIGAARAGTTALAAFLGRHPEVFIPVKEPNYFSGWLSRKPFDGPQGKNVRPEFRCGTIEQYSRLFEGSRGFKARGEASVSYLPDGDAPALIQQTIPDVRLFAILRQPAERAFAHFHLQRFNRLEPVADFLEALEQERRGLRRNWMPSLRYVESVSSPVPHRAAESLPDRRLAASTTLGVATNSRNTGCGRGVYARFQRAACRHPGRISGLVGPPAHQADLARRAEEASPSSWGGSSVVVAERRFAQPGIAGRTDQELFSR